MMNLPLAGKRVAITRAVQQSGELIEQLKALGASPIITPTIRIAPLEDYSELDSAIQKLSSYHWLIVTSVNGVQSLFTRMKNLEIDFEALKSLHIGAIGPATSHALAEQGVIAEFVPPKYVAESILDTIGPVANQHILLPRADIAREALSAGLRERGAIVTELAAYRTIPGEGIPKLARLLQIQEIDAITFTSSSTVRYLLEGWRLSGLSLDDIYPLFENVAIACIGPITAATVRQVGLSVSVEADEYTRDGLVTALVQYFGR
jgi:uroporphyrinogen III methyltransferase/synthase